MAAPSRGTCPDPELITALVDGELGADARDAVLGHLPDCADCRAAVDAERDVRGQLRALPEPVASADLLARLLAVPRAVGAEPADARPEPHGDAAPDGPAHAPPAEVADLGAARERGDRPSRRAPAILAAAASVVVFLVGTFAFIGAWTQNPAPARPAGTTAIVPAADRLSEEHGATSSEVGLGGPGFSAVSYGLTAPSPSSSPSAAAP